MFSIFRFAFRFVKLLLLYCCLTSFAREIKQTADSYHTRDSVNQTLSWMINDRAAMELKQRSAAFREHAAVLKQSKNFILIKNEIERARNFLSQGYQYPATRHEITQLIKWNETVVEGVIKNKDSIQTIRNLTTTSTLLQELLNRTNHRLLQILSYHKSLGQQQYVLDSLAMDSVLYMVPKDSGAMMNYFQNLQFLARDLIPVNKDLKSSLDSIQKIEIKVNLFKFDLESEISKTKILRAKILDQLNTNELGNLGQNSRNERPFGKIILYSIGKANLVLLFYFVNHLGLVTLMILFIIGVYLYLVMLRRNVNKESDARQLMDQAIVLQQPLGASILLVLTIFPLFLPMPPFVFNGLLWIACAAALSVMIRESVSRFEFNTWLFFILLFLLAFFSNLMLRHSSLERWGMLVLSVSGCAAGIFFLATKKKKEIPEKVHLVAIGLMVVHQILAIYFNLTGGYNVSKILMANGLTIVVVAYLIFWTARILLSTLRISYYFHLTDAGERRLLSKDLANTNVPSFVYALFITAWFILIGRDFFFYQTIIDPFSESLKATRTIGEFSFNYKSILVFFLVLIVSGVVSRVVSFLASDKLVLSDKPKKNKLGSWLVLIRILIIITGVLVAFIAAGIPMDRFAFILGALSVGIGFGLQSLVNNFISGVVIAFEKPLNVGDIVEFAGRTGTIKSIGIRSSVITTWDGADVIIPNGDILNQHLVNWTLGNSARRFELGLNVGFGTDFEKTEKLLLELMQKDTRILKNPPAFVLVNKFNSSSIDLSLKFWVSHFDIGLDVRSDLVRNIEVLFKEHRIEIPFPRQDVHIL